MSKRHQPGKTEMHMVSLTGKAITCARWLAGRKPRMWPTATMTPPRLAPITSPVILASYSFSCLMRNHANAYCEPRPLAE